MLTVHSLYIYHALLELYKILKFRTPYCLFEIICPPGVNTIELTIRVTPSTQQCQRMSFLYQAVIFWNRYYKKLLTPFTIPTHQSYLLKHNLTQSESIHYDYSTKISTFKSRLSHIIFKTQSMGDTNTWLSTNHMFIH